MSRMCYLWMESLDSYRNKDSNQIASCYKMKLMPNYNDLIILHIKARHWSLHSRITWVKIRNWSSAQKKDSSNKLHLVSQAEIHSKIRMGVFQFSQRGLLSYSDRSMVFHKKQSVYSKTKKTFLEPRNFQKYLSNTNHLSRHKITAKHNPNILWIFRRHSNYIVKYL